MNSPGYPITVIVTKLATARAKNAFGAGKHRVYLGEGVPVEYTASAVSDQQQSEKLSFLEKVKFRNNFDENVPVNAELILIMGADGIGNIVNWPCDE